MSEKKSAMLHFGGVVLAAFLMAGMVGCTPETGDRTGMVSDTAVAPPAAETPAPGTGAVPPGGMPVALSSAEIAGVLSASDSAEIKPSELALERAENSAVKAYAQRMVRDHGMLEDSLRSMSTRENITPAQSSLSQQLDSQTQATMQRLQVLTGAEFDQAYMQAMVQSHQEALSMVDNQLLPATQDQELRTALTQQVRPIISSHLAEAQEIQQSLSSMTTGASGTGSR